MALKDWLNPVGGLISSITGAIGQSMSNRAQAKENEKNRQFALDMWNKENEYNLYTNQVQRLQDAGLNPALVYGDASSTLSAHAQTPNTDNRYNNPFQRGLSDYFTAQQTEIQRQNSESTTKLNSALENKANEEARLASEEANRKAIENSYADANELVDLLIKGNTSEAGRLANQYARQANPMQISILNETLENAKRDGKIKEEEANRIKALINKIEAEIKTEGERYNTQVAETGKVKQETSTLAKQGAYYDAARTQALANADEAEANAARIRMLAPMERNKLAQEIANDKLLADQIVEVTGLKKREAQKLVIDMSEALKNNRVERWKTTVRDHFGTNTMSTIFNIMFQQRNNNLVGISEEDYTPRNISGGATGSW